MIAHVLCSGPSLNAYRAAPPHADLRIAVNRAATVVAADWWVFNDADVFAYFKPLGTPQIVSSRRVYREVGPNEFRDLFRWSFWSAFESLVPRHPDWTLFSSLTAVVLAAHLGHKSITMFGADWQGTEDFTGSSLFGDEGRTPGRWDNEHRLFNHVASYLTHKGVAHVERSMVGAPEAQSVAV